MSIPALAVTRWGRPGSPVIVLGPSLGTSAEALWGPCAELLAGRFEVLAWDLPGHGHSAPPAGPFTMAELAAGVLAAVDAALEVAVGGAVGAAAGAEPDAARPRRRFAYAGDSIGGAIGLELLLAAADRVQSAVLISTAATFGPAQGWLERAARVRGSGTPSMVEHSARVWFAPGFLQRRPARGSALLHALQSADPSGYAAACDALAGFDVRQRLSDIQAPVLAVAGAADQSTPADRLREIADGVRDGRLVVLDGAAHLPPIETPERVAMLITEHVDGALRQRDVFDAGMAVRRAVLGDEHVDRATAGRTPLTADFQDMITRYAWGTIWTRPGLDRRTRSLITLTALLARGHHEEFAMHLRAARRIGVTEAEITEILLQAAIYLGVPDANTGFRIAGEIFATEARPGARPPSEPDPPGPAPHASRPAGHDATPRD